MGHVTNADTDRGAREGHVRWAAWLRSHRPISLILLFVVYAFLTISSITSSDIALLRLRFIVSFVSSMSEPNRLFTCHVHCDGRRVAFICFSSLESS